jgi:hypothetical protein
LELLVDLSSLGRRVIFSPDLGRGLFGNIVENVATGRFLAPRYANPPWLIDVRSLGVMAGTAKESPALYEEGEADRYLSALAQLAGVPILPFDPADYSQAHLEAKHLHELRTVIHQGGTMVHGVKDGWMLAAARQFRDEAWHKLGSQAKGCPDRQA